MAGGEESRSVVYCVVPWGLAVRLHELLRRHFADDPRVEVVVERRTHDRRFGADRRGDPTADDAPGRRRIRARTGRRAGERRAVLVEVAPLRLPRRARLYADLLVFMERIEPSSQAAEDRDTARIVTRLQAGDPDAFAVLYLRYFDRVYAYTRIVIRDAHEAEDIAQQVFVSALESIDRYVPHAPFRAWLFTIARNVTVSHLRRSGRVELDTAQNLERRCASVELDPLPGAFDWISDRELSLFVERLPLAQREVLVLRYMLDLRMSEIAELLARSPADVRSLHSRATRFLRARLTSLGHPTARGRRVPARGYLRQAPVIRMRRFALTP